jgi:hypothetical protein
VAPYVAITLDKVEMLRVAQEVTVKHSYIFLKNSITFSIHVSCHFYTFLLNYALCKKKSMNSRKLKCAVVCAEQLMQFPSESPKRVCVCVCVCTTREVTRCTGHKGAG